MSTLPLPTATVDRAAAPLPGSGGPPTHGVVRRVSAGRLVAGVVGRACHPGHLWRAAGLQRSRKANRRQFDDHRLSLYAKFLPDGFLHYGYFDDPTRHPDDISLRELGRAQARYAELLIELIGDAATTGPVLDVGCGMGGLARMLRDGGYAPVAVTPDKIQAAFVAKYVPGVPVVRSKLEDLPVAAHAGRYGSVVTAESLQYLKLDRALPVIDAVVRPGGSWVACDYFLTGPSADRTCHGWDVFVAAAAAAGWRLTHQRDVTANVLPFLAFVHMLGSRFGLPLIEFFVLRLRRKQPGLHHLLSGLIGHLEGVATDNVGLIDPAQFVRDRRYMLLKLERAR